MTWVQLPKEGLLIYQLKISILDLTPMIWRRVQVSNLTTLGELHYVIQGIFNWEGYHLHRFETPQGQFGPHWDDSFDLDGEVEKNENEQMLHSIFTGKVREIKYIYDFGDDWWHRIRLEKRLKPVPGERYPQVIDGQRTAPLEDSGGPWGYGRILDILEADEITEEEENLLDWAGGRFDPEKFNLAACQRRLAKHHKPYVLERKKRTTSTKPKKKP